jgi:hypothetical protein
VLLGIATSAAMLYSMMPATVAARLRVETFKVGQCRLSL